MLSYKNFYAFFIIIFYFATNFIFPSNGKQYQFLSPVPYSDFNTLENNIIIKEGSKIDQSSLIEGVIIIQGSKSGKLTGQLILASDKKTIIFKPNKTFLPDETIEITINEGIKTIDGRSLQAFHYTFRTEPANYKQILNSYNYESEIMSATKIKNTNSKSRKISFPEITTNILNESAIGEGKIFLTAYGVINQSFQSDPTVSSSVLIVNNDGSTFFAKDIGSNQGAGLTDFKMHPNSLMSYPKVLKNYSWTGGAEVIHMIMDESFAVVDSFQMGNGYTAETHDFQLLPNGHALLMAYYLIPIDLSQIVPGSHPDAYIDGVVIQELDTDKNVIFQWRTWDYANTSTIPWSMVPSNTAQFINVFHANSLRLDNDGNILLGTVSMGLKISRQTGQILWIIGGIMNQFTFSNVSTLEALGDFGGHTFHRLTNGNILVYDNSPFPWQPGYGQISSEVVEYEIDEENKTARLVWKYQPEQIISGWHAGGVQRLPNGNTVIGWGGPPNEGDIQIPIMTEVTQSGEKVFELFYQGSDLESYRAFRFLLNDGLPNSEITKAEVAPGNTYEFTEFNQADPGISIKINDVSSFGYNELTVKNYNFAPSSPEFPGKAPLVVPRRIVLSNFGITTIDANLRFDITNWEVTDPDNTIIYYREFENDGLFIPLETTYNFVTGKLTANITGFGEFILAKADLVSQPFAPIPNSPENESTVNYQLPIQLTWSPVGFASTYSLQVSFDENFTNLFIDENSLTEAVYDFDATQPNTQYYWRVKTQNDAGESQWCETQTFTAVESFILIIKPNGRERWHIGLDYYIEWEDNINQDVIVSLYRNDAFISNIITTGNSFYSWEVNLDLQPADDYKIRISSVNDETLFDISDADFSIIDTVSNNGIPTEYKLEQNYPNPFNSSTIIRYQLLEPSNVNIKVYDMIGCEVATLVNENKPAGSDETTWNGSNYAGQKLSSGVYFYTLISGNYSETKKMVLLK